MRGYIEIAVKPGIVLISLMLMAPSGPTKTSTRKYEEKGRVCGRKGGFAKDNFCFYESMALTHRKIICSCLAEQWVIAAGFQFLVLRFSAFDLSS